MATESNRERSPRKSSSKKGRGGLRDVVVGAVGSDALLDLVERLGLVDMLVGRLKSRLEDTDMDELFDEITDYMRRNPEVLVVTLGAVTVAAGLLVWLNNRREWDGNERRRQAAAEARQNSGQSGGSQSKSARRSQ